MATTLPWDSRKAWREFRLRAEAAANYYRPYAMYINQSHRDVLLEQFLPPLLYIRGVAIFDDALELWLDQQGIKTVSPLRDDLNGRLEFLDARKAVANAADLHVIRKERNRLAHEPDTTCTWARLASDMAAIEQALVALDLARPTGTLEYFGERSAMKSSSEPGIKFTRTFTYGVAEDGQRVLEISWQQNFLEDKHAP
jgi:hypothetical protein